jgi:5S rRNA maturation endonuclease (ribonuclease M5)
MVTYKALLKEIELLKKEIVIVEGIKDRKALQKLGVKKIIILKKPLFMVVEEVKERTSTCVVLTDLDPTGKKLYGRLKKDLNRFGVQVKDRFRNFLFKETTLRQIEGLDTFLEKIKS